jgi:cilia- and flagella-associated protein 52
VGVVRCGVVCQVDVHVPKMHAMEAKMGTLKRMIQCVAISADDKFAYCGTKTGDDDDTGTVTLG